MDVDSELNVGNHSQTLDQCMEVTTEMSQEAIIKEKEAKLQRQRDLISRQL